MNLIFFFLGIIKQKSVIKQTRNAEYVERIVSILLDIHRLRKDVVISWSISFFSRNPTIAYEDTFLFFFSFCLFYFWQISPFIDDYNTLSFSFTRDLGEPFVMFIHPRKIKIK